MTRNSESRWLLVCEYYGREIEAAVKASQFIRAKMLNDQFLAIVRHVNAQAAV